MATGKTTMITKILDYDDSLKRILWITHRQTLTKQIIGSFKKNGFINYMDTKGCLFDYDRVIVQIDSIMRIRKYKYDDNNAAETKIVTDHIILKQYDLVIIDEIEGNLNHFISPFLSKADHSSRDKFNIILECINGAKKLLVMDADIGMRTKLFTDKFEKSIIINNNYQPMKKIFTITNDGVLFDAQLFADIDAKKNVCIISMSANALEKIETELKKKQINYVMHTSKTDDKLKNKLEDVNNFWTKFQIVAFSPQIESGIDFNEDHFDKIYCIIKDGQMTCSQRGFLQMVGRIRKIRDPNILCHYTGSIQLNSSIYTYDDVLSYFRYYEELNGNKIIENVQYDREIRNGEINLVRKKSDISLFDHISIYDEMERLNKDPTIFMTVLNKLIQRAGHDLKFKIVKDPANKVYPDVKKLEEKLAEIDETDYILHDLINKQSNNQLNETEKLALTKIFFMKTFGVKNSKNKDDFQNFCKEYYKERIAAKRYEKMFPRKVIDIDESDDDNDDINELTHNKKIKPNIEKDDNTDIEKFDNFDDGKDKSRHKIIIDLLNRLLRQNKDSYTSDELVNITLANVQYTKGIDDIIKNSIYFKNEEKCEALFFKTGRKYNPKADHKIQYYVNTIKSLLAAYCIDLCRGKRVWTKERKMIYEYSLSVDERIKNIIEFKHNETNKIKIFPSIFK